MVGESWPHWLNASNWRFCPSKAPCHIGGSTTRGAVVSEFLKQARTNNARGHDGTASAIELSTVGGHQALVTLVVVLVSSYLVGGGGAAKLL